MSQLFAAVYEIHSASADQPVLRLNLIIDGRNDSIAGHAQLDTSNGESRGISVRGHHTEIDGEQPLQAIVLAGIPSIFSSMQEEASAFQLLMVLPSAFKEGQVCYKMRFGRVQPRVIEIRDGIAHAVLPELYA